MAKSNTLSLPTPDVGYCPGDLLRDKYELLRPIGEGGMGVVWIARDLTLEVEVAVKISRRFLDDGDAMMAQRALSEARLAAQFAHPAVCRVLDFGLSALGDPFVVSELLHGEALDEVVAEQVRLPALVAVQMLLPILDGLAALHSKGIVHRDVKPANMFLSRDWQGRVQPKLLDFGIARLMHDRKRITTPGAICGTACYMSPEQARGSQDVDSRSDLWSFCASLYELITGSPPFDGENYNAVLWAVLTTEPPSISEFAAGDAALSAIVRRGMRRAPSERFATAQELAHALARWLLGQGVEADICGHSLRERLGSVPKATGSPLARAPNSWIVAGTPPALSTTLIRDRRRPVRVRRTGRKLLLAAAACVGLLLSAASLVRSSVAPVASEPELAEPELSEAATLGKSFTSLPVVVSAPPVASTAPLPPAPAPPAKRPVARLAPKPSASPAPAPAESAPAPPSARRAPPPNKTNDLGFEFGF